MKKKLKYLAFVVLLGFISFLYGFSIHRNRAEKIKNVVVEFDSGDNIFLTHSMVNKLLIQNNDSIKNQPKSVLDLHRLEQKVLSNPYVEKAAVFVTIDGELKTIIKQREPIARIENKSTSYYIDMYGVKVPLSKNFSARVVLVTGVNTPAEIKEVTKLVNIILADDFLKKEIIGIQKLKTNEYVFNVRSGNYKIDFGKFINTGVKFKKLKAFYNKALADKTIQNYQTINLKYHNQVVCAK
ncbi:cell division protein FtsQ/DivIB [Tenacibaculum sp. UWU-22]|uniref:cell division protein FtsQ/DivIB n=1 Tax=Tenacibaculum sp. UWU-22 TaxID=3234187 RepID=UPI0034DB7A37